MRIRYILAIVALALGVNVIAIPAAEAGSSGFARSECWHDDGGVFWGSTNVCATVRGTFDRDGTGVTVTEISLTCGPAGSFENDIAVNGREMKLVNDNFVSQWSAGDGGNIDGNCHKAYLGNGNVSMPGTDWVIFRWEFHPRYQNRPDPDGYKSIQILCENPF